MKNFLLKKKFWFAASTHKGEDNFCLKTHIKIKKKYIKILLQLLLQDILDRVKKNIKNLCEKNNFKTQILNKNDLILKNKEIIIINSFGAFK